MIETARYPALLEFRANAEVAVMPHRGARGRVGSPWMRTTTKLLQQLVLRIFRRSLARRLLMLMQRESTL